MDAVTTISVIIPTYNNGRWLGEAIDSVLCQSSPPVEIIVVDDGSTDETEDIVRQYDDPRICYIRQQNAGVSAARNTGLARATGEFVAFLDGDDRWRPEALTGLLEVMDTDSTLVFCFGNFVRFVERTGQILSDQFVYYPEISGVLAEPVTARWPTARYIARPAFASLVGFGEFPAFTQVMLFRRGLIDGFRFNPALKRCEDAEFVLRAATQGNVACIPEVIAEVRRHEHNASANVALMPLDKLKALECVALDPATEVFRIPLQQRLNRARFDATGAFLAARRYRDAFCMWRAACRSEGEPWLKARRSLGVLLRWLQRLH